MCLFLRWFICCSKVALEAKIALSCLQHKKLLKTLKVAKKLPSTIYQGLVTRLQPISSFKSVWSRALSHGSSHFSLSFAIIVITYMGGGGMPPPITFFSKFSKAIFYLQLEFSGAVRISIRHILTQNWWESVAMITKYDVISSRWSRHFWIKMRVFHLFRWKKHKMFTKSAQFKLCNILHV